MTKSTVTKSTMISATVGATVIAALALAAPAGAQQAISNSSKSARCAPSDTNCQTQSRHTSRYRHHMAYRGERTQRYRTGNADFNRNAWGGNANTAWNNNWNNNGWNNNGWNNDNWDRYHTGFWPGDVAADVVGGAVSTAGAIATAPFRAGAAYAYDNGYYNNGYNGGWNQSYAQRNGNVCTPGGWFRGNDGRRYRCP